MKRGHFFVIALLLACALQVAAPGLSSTCFSKEPAGIAFVDEHGAERSVSEAELARLARKSVKVTGPDKQLAEYEGTELAELLQHLGVVLGKELRGPRIANYLLFEADDGYRVVLAIAEVDPATTDKVVLLSNRKNRAALPDKEGPWRLVIPDDKRPVRWIRMIKRISIQSAATPSTPK